MSDIFDATELVSMRIQHASEPGLGNVDRAFKFYRTFDVYTRPLESHEAIRAWVERTCIMRQPILTSSFFNLDSICLTAQCFAGFTSALTEFVECHLEIGGQD